MDTVYPEGTSFDNSNTPGNHDNEFGGVEADLSISITGWAYNFIINSIETLSAGINEVQLVTASGVQHTRRVATQWLFNQF